MAIERQKDAMEIRLARNEVLLGTAFAVAGASFAGFVLTYGFVRFGLACAVTAALAGGFAFLSSRRRIHLSASGLVIVGALSAEAIPLEQIDSLSFDEVPVYPGLAVIDVQLVLRRGKPKRLRFQPPPGVDVRALLKDMQTRVGEGEHPDVS